MALVWALVYAVVVVAAADRVMLLLESRGHVNWRRTGRKALPSGPAVGLDGLLDGRADSC
jgi:hypothetical protein